MKGLLAVLALSFLAFQNADASIITTFDLRSGGNAGPDLDSSGTVTINDVTLTVSVVPGFSASSASFNSLSGQAGVDTSGVSAGAGDDSDGIDGDDGETLSFTVTFNSAQVSSVSLQSVDFAGVGSAGAGDAALVSLNSSLIATLETGVSGFNGSTDVWTPTSSISVASGDIFTFGADVNVGLQSITFDITPVPEPSTMILFSLACLGFGFFTHQRRRKLQYSGYGE